MEDDTECVICGKTGLSRIEGDGGTECELNNGEWVCSFECWEIAVDGHKPLPPPKPIYYGD